MECKTETPIVQNDQSNLKADLASFTEVTTMHGVRFLSNRDTQFWKKIIWIVLLLVMVTGLCVSFTDSIRTYYKYESVISTKLLRNNSLLLPAVSVCNLNLVKRSALVNLHPELIPYGFEDLNVFTGLGLKEGNSQTDIFVQLLGHLKFKPFIEETGPTAEDTFVECAIGVHKQNCTDYISTFWTDNGLCFTFNSDEYAEKHGLLQSRLPGNIYGIQITLDINPDDYMVSNFLSNGMQVLVHHPYQYPMMNLKRFVIEAGKEYFVSLKLHETRILPTPYSTLDCFAEEDLRNEIKSKSYGVQYSEDGCFAKCLIENIFNCDCNLLSTLDDACTVYDAFTCSFADHFQEFLQQGINCSECLPTCISTHYDFKLSSADFPNANAATYSMQRGWALKNITEFRNRYSRMFVYFETLQYTVTEQLATMSLVQLLSNIGGQLGLYLGASLITLMEIIDFTLVFCVKMCKKRNQVSHTTKVKPMVVT